MERKNQKEMRPFSYYLEQYTQIDPMSAAIRLDIAFDGNAFVLTMLGCEYRLTYPVYAISSPTRDALALQRLPAQTFLLRYLLRGQRLPATGRWLHFRQIPWGEVYLQPFTGRCLRRAAACFGKNLVAFSQAAKSLGGVPISGADAGFTFCFLGEYQLQMLLWAPDEEFPANAQILYSDNFACGFSAEDCVVAAELLIASLCGRLPQS